MLDFVKDNLVKILRETADKIDAGNSEVDEEQAVKIMELVAHRPLTKEEAAMYLHIWPSRFDTLIREGKIPKGRKKLGQKNKIWYLDELENSEYMKSLTK